MCNPKPIKMEDQFKSANTFAEKNSIAEIAIRQDKDGSINGTYLNIENRVGEVSKNRKVVRKSYFISVELIENVLKFGIFNRKFNNRFLLGYVNNRFYFLSGNLVNNVDVGYIKDKMEEINKVFEADNSKEQLRQMYKDKLREVGLTEKSVKIGIIDLARKLDYKILYNFVKIDDIHSVFSLICTVDDKS